MSPRDYNLLFKHVLELIECLVLNLTDTFSGSTELAADLKEYGVKISMDGRGRCHDNARMERFWWALKYEDILLKEYKSLPQLRRGVQGYVNFYNGVRLHSALNYRTPDAVYEEGLHNTAALLLQKKKTNTCNPNFEDV